MRSKKDEYRAAASPIACVKIRLPRKTEKLPDGM